MKLTNLKIYYFLILTNNLWFITSNWLNFWLKYMSFKEVGVIDAIAFLIGILLEFPSGVISDKIGRKQTLLISQSIQFLGSLIITLSSNALEIGLGFVIFQIGVAFYSGTVEAFGYESANREDKDYSSVLVYSSFLTNFGYLGSILVGGFLYNLNNNLPNILFSLNFLVGLIISFLSTDFNFEKNESLGLRSKSRFNLYSLILFVILMSVAFSFDYGFAKLIILEKFSNLETNYWYIFGSTLLSLSLTSLILSKITFYNKTLLISLLTLSLCYFLSFYSYIPLFMVLSFLAVFIYQLSLKYINEKVEDSQRAGVISLFNLFYKLPYVLIALYLGYNLS